MKLFSFFIFITMIQASLNTFTLAETGNNSTKAADPASISAASKNLLQSFQKNISQTNDAKALGNLVKKYYKDIFKPTQKTPGSAPLCTIEEWKNFSKNITPDLAKKFGGNASLKSTLESISEELLDELQKEAKQRAATQPDNIKDLELAFGNATRTYLIPLIKNNINTLFFGNNPNEVKGKLWFQNFPKTDKFERYGFFNDHPCKKSHSANNSIVRNLNGIYLGKFPAKYQIGRQNLFQLGNETILCEALEGDTLSDKEKLLIQNTLNECQKENIVQKICQDGIFESAYFFGTNTESRASQMRQRLETELFGGWKKSCKNTSSTGAENSEKAISEILEKSDYIVKQAHTAGSTNFFDLPSNLEICTYERTMPQLNSKWQNACPKKNGKNIPITERIIIVEVEDSQLGYGSNNQRLQYDADFIIKKVKQRIQQSNWAGAYYDASCNSETRWQSLFFDWGKINQFEQNKDIACLYAFYSEDIQNAPSFGYAFSSPTVEARELLIQASENVNFGETSSEKGRMSYADQVLNLIEKRQKNSIFKNSCYSLSGVRPTESKAPPKFRLGFDEKTESDFIEYIDGNDGSQEFNKKITVAETCRLNDEYSFALKEDKKTIVFFGPDGFIFEYSGPTPFFQTSSDGKISCTISSADNPTRDGFFSVLSRKDNKAAIVDLKNKKIITQNISLEGAKNPHLISPIYDSTGNISKLRVFLSDNNADIYEQVVLETGKIITTKVPRSLFSSIYSIFDESVIVQENEKILKYAWDTQDKTPKALQELRVPMDFKAPFVPPDCDVLKNYSKDFFILRNCKDKITLVDRKTFKEITRFESLLFSKDIDFNKIEKNNKGDWELDFEILGQGYKLTPKESNLQKDKQSAMHIP